MVAGQNIRPFVCDGHPQECEIFIVGINPATSMDAPFLDFWTDEKGFNKKLWLEQYTREREAKPLQEGRTRRLPLSNTRSRIEWLCAALMPHKVLETNLYFKATATAAELSKDHRDISLFNFLVASIKPKVMLLHGKEVKEAVEASYHIHLVENEFVESNLHEHPVKILAVKHLSRGWSKEATQGLAMKLESTLNSHDSPNTS